MITPDVAAEEVAGDDERQDGHEDRDEQLPRPEVVLEEETDKREHGAQDATDRLRTEVEDESRHQATETDEQALEGAVEYREHIGKAHRGTTETADETHKDPHLQDDVLFERPTVGTLIVLVEEVHHQRCSHQRDAEPDPRAPELVPQNEREELHKEEERRGVTPGKKEILARRDCVTAYFSTDLTDHIKFVYRRHWICNNVRCRLSPPE